MIEKEANSTSLFLLQEIDDLFNDGHYEIEMQSCSNPTCNCGSSNLVVLKKEADQKNVEFVFPFDVHKQFFYPTTHKSFFCKEEEKLYIKDSFADVLTKEHWNLLSVSHYRKKNQLIQQTDINEIDYDFGYEHYEDLSLMEYYSEIFPAGTMLFEWKNERYLLNEAYCKNPACDCKEVLLNFLKPDPTIGIQDYNAPEVGSTFYHFKSGKLDIQKGSAKTIKFLLQALKKTYPNVDSILAQRYINMRKLYKKARLKYDQNSHVTTPKISRKLVGRNEPCPCGSGRKYKRCCGKK